MESKKLFAAVLGSLFVFALPLPAMAQSTSTQSSTTTTSQDAPPRAETTRRLIPRQRNTGTTTTSV